MLSFFDFRNDIRKVISELSKYCTIIIYVRKEHEELVKSHLPKNTEYRLIEERKPGLYSWTMELLFIIFRKIPKTEMNYYLMEEFKTGNLEERKIKNKSYFLLKMHRIAPHVLTYDLYLKLIKSSEKTEINDIDAFLCLTEIYDDHLFSRLIKEQKRIFVYVYSWDHSCKHTRFSKKVKYLVWNNGIKEDLNIIQQIDKNNISVIGATQLGYLEEFKNFASEKSDKKNYYFGCGIGITSLIDNEIEVIQMLSETISKVDKKSKLLVRPYPNNKNWGKYKTLLNLSNIELDDSFKQTDLSVNETDILYKFNTINSAKGFFHLGTTLGLEACYTDCPSFILNTIPDDGKGVNIFNFVNQYQNKKYLIDASNLNTINSETQLEQILQNIEDVNYMKLNYKIRSEFPSRSFDQMAKAIINHLR